MEPTFFAAPADFCDWLEKNYERESELLVGFYKVGSGKPSMTWPQSVDEALCFGWIDGVRRSINGESYSIRFTPRKAQSVWSAVNIKKVEELSAKGLMKPAGLAAFARREEGKSKIYAYENAPAKLSDVFEKRFRTNEKAWTFFCSQAPSYQKRAIYWVMTAKQDATRQSRLEKLIVTSADEKRI